MMKSQIETAAFGAGCFWGVEEIFIHLKGIKSTAVGFMGGKTVDPSYEKVCTDKTGHAEVVQLQYNPTEISYRDLLSKFWEIHDPTTLNRQGPDVGSQYRSVIFYYTPAQKAAAKKSKAELEDSDKYNRSIVTEIIPASDFYRAEEYHQQYFHKTGRSSCVV